MATPHHVGGVDIEPLLYQKLGSRDFLVTCLQKANLDAELLGDVADACDINEYSALLLAAGDLTIEHIASKLYLTEDEARAVLGVCRRECRASGVQLPGVEEDTMAETGSRTGRISRKSSSTKRAASGENRDLIPSIRSVRVSENDESPVKAAESSAPAEPTLKPRAEGPKKQSSKVIQLEPEAVPQGEKPAPSKSNSSASLQRGLSRIPSTSSGAATPSKTPSSKSLSATAPEPTSAIPPSPKPTPSAASSFTRAAPAASNPPPTELTPPSDHKPTPPVESPVSPKLATPFASPSTQARGHTPRSSDAGSVASARSTASTPSSARRAAVRPRSAMPAAKKAVVEPVRVAARPASARAINSHQVHVDEDSLHLPSYLKGTKASQARAKKDEEVVEGKRRGIPGAGFISTTLLRPTQAFMSWASGNNRTQAFQDNLRGSGAASSGHMSGQNSTTSIKSCSSPRPTKMAPFHLSKSSERQSLTSEEMQMCKAHEEAAAVCRYKPVPKFVYEARPEVVREAPKAPEFKPFNLASLERHNKFQQDLGKKMEGEKREAAEAMAFKARQFKVEELKPNLPEFHKVAPTKGTAPRFASEERLQYRHEVLDPRKREREEAERAAHEAQEAARLAEEGIKAEEPHSPFKAAPMPNFSKPFKPDLTTVAGPTQAAEFDFETDKRLGKVDVSKRVGDEDGKFTFSGDGYLDPFAGSLRSDGGHSRGAGPIKKASVSMRSPRS